MACQKGSGVSPLAGIILARLCTYQFSPFFSGTSYGCQEIAIYGCVQSFVSIVRIVTLGFRIRSWGACLPQYIDIMQQ